MSDTIEAKLAGMIDDAKRRGGRIDGIVMSPEDFRSIIAAGRLEGVCSQRGRLPNPCKYYGYDVFFSDQPARIL